MTKYEFLEVPYNEVMKVAAKSSNFITHMGGRHEHLRVIVGQGLFVYYPAGSG